MAMERRAVGRDAVERFGAVRFGAERFAVGRFALRDGEAFRAAGRLFAELRAALELLRAVDRFAAGFRAPLRFAADGRRAVLFFDEDLRAGERFEDFDDFFAGADFFFFEDFTDFFDDFFDFFDGLRAGDFFDDGFLDDFLDVFLEAAIRFLLFQNLTRADRNPGKTVALRGSCVAQT